MAFIETTAATGSGVLIRDGYIITNYHVVWPYDSVRVVFPDGTELEGVPIVGLDPMADLALLGPVDLSAQPLPLKDAENDTAIGSKLFLIGYPAEAFNNSWNTLSLPRVGAIWDDLLPDRCCHRGRSERWSACQL